MYGYMVLIKKLAKCTVMNRFDGVLRFLALGTSSRLGMIMATAGKLLVCKLMIVGVAVSM